MREIYEVLIFRKWFRRSDKSENKWHCLIFRGVSRKVWPVSILRYCRYLRDIHFHVSRDIFMSIYARKNRAMHFA